MNLYAHESSGTPEHREYFSKLRKRLYKFSRVQTPMRLLILVNYVTQELLRSTEICKTSLCTWHVRHAGARTIRCDRIHLVFRANESGYICAVDATGIRKSTGTRNETRANNAFTRVKHTTGLLGKNRKDDSIMQNVTIKRTYEAQKESSFFSHSRCKINLLHLIAGLICAPMSSLDLNAPLISILNLYRRLY